MSNQAALRIDEPPAGDGLAPAKPKSEETAIDPVMRAEIAAYISQMTGEMVAMARAAKLDLLAYFLDMARIEANVQRNRT